jgi:uncharacterized protein
MIQTTKNWLEKVVIGLNLCPFAKHPFKSDVIRYAVYDGDDLRKLTEMVANELLFLAENPATEVETTLCIVPNMLQDFEEYLDFLDFTHIMLDELKLEGVIQVASFHPNYQFDGTAKDAPENYTNRSPYPIFHLLREASVTRASDTYPHVEDIPKRNIELMRKLGVEGYEKIVNG